MTTTARAHRPAGTPAQPPAAGEDLAALCALVRAGTDALAAPLAPEDMMLQSMPEASPAKWHLAHTTWFFEEFVLRPHAPGYRSPDDRFAFLFNSYYVQAGPRHARDKRGLVSRPGVQAVLDYRRVVDEALAPLLAEGPADPQVAALIELGCHHEMQHQELLVTDLLHGLSFNPLLPVYRDPEPMPVAEEVPLTFSRHEGGLVEIGHAGEGFAYDCEQPRHPVWLAPFEIAERPASNRDWIAFIEDGGYAAQTLWLVDGWAERERQGWDAPLYWWREDGAWWTYTLRGPQPVNIDAPVCHVSFYEAEAYARWAGARLPTEAEWETAFSARSRAISSTAARCARGPAAGPGGTCGNGPRARSPPTPASARRRGRSASTTASSWPTSSCCAAAPAPRPRGRCGRATATSSTRTCAGR